MAVRALYQVFHTNQKLQESEAPQRTKDNELFARMKLDMVKTHMMYLSVHICRHEMKSVDEKLKLHLEDLLRVYCIKSL